MSNRPWLGLLVAGPMSPTLFRLPNLSAHLGPVASASLRVASRLANRLKAGTAVAPDQLTTAELVLVSGPEADFHALLTLALHPDINWTGRTVLFLDFHHDSSDLLPLRHRGASVGTLDCLDAFPDPRFVADVDPSAHRLLQRFATATGAGIFFITPGRKQFFAAGAAFTGTLLTPLVAATVDCLKKSGLSQAQAIQITERNTQQTLRSFVKAGRKGWTGTLPDGDLVSTRRHLQALQAENELLSDYFASTAHMALLLFGEDAEWLGGLDSAPAAPIIEAMEDSQTRRLVAAGRLAANLAHDWNNLLTLLAAQAGEIAHVLPPDHPARALADDLATSIDQASDSPRRLLNWLREEPGTLAPASVNEVIRAALPLVQLALGRGVLCNVELADDLPQIPLDAPLLRSALLNLATNAAAAMNARGAFTIRTAATAHFIHLTVADTGCGMDPETRQRVFEPFFSTRQANGGHGLGLETVKSMAEAHRATVDLDTAPGEGTTFTIGFPLAALTMAASAASR